MAGTSYEESPTPLPPLEGEKFDSHQAARGNASTKESKSMIGKLMDFLSPFEKTPIEIEGKHYFILAVEEGSGSYSDASFWDIEVTIREGRLPVFQLKPNGATIAPASTVELAAAYPLVGVNTEWTPDAGKILYIKVVKNPDTGELTMSLKYDTGWADMPLVYKIDQDDAERDYMAEYYYPLYATYGNKPAGNYKKINNFYLQRLVIDSSLGVEPYFVKEAESDRAFAGIIFVPQPAAFYG